MSSSKTATTKIKALETLGISKAKPADLCVLPAAVADGESVAASKVELPQASKESSVVTVAHADQVFKAQTCSSAKDIELTILAQFKASHL